MIELSNERIDQILHEETAKKEEVSAILRSIYVRYMRLYEKYFADIDALSDEKIAEMKAYHEETVSFIKYFYMDIPQDICAGLKEFDHKVSRHLLGPEWHKCLFENYDEFLEKHEDEREEDVKVEFTRQVLSDFYGVMDYILRDGFGTGSMTVKKFVDGIKGLLFEKE